MVESISLCFNRSRVLGLHGSQPDLQPPKPMGEWSQLPSREHQQLGAGKSKSEAQARVVPPGRRAQQRVGGK